MENKMEFMDTNRLEQNKSLNNQALALHGLEFQRQGADELDEFTYVVVMTEISGRGDTKITGLCIRSPRSEFTGRFYGFFLSEIALTAVSTHDLTQRLRRDASDPNWGTR